MQCYLLIGNWKTLWWPQHQQFDLYTFLILGIGKYPWMLLLQFYSARQHSNLYIYYLKQFPWQIWFRAAYFSTSTFALLKILLCIRINTISIEKIIWQMLFPYNWICWLCAHLKVILFKVTQSYVLNNNFYKPRTQPWVYTNFKMWLYLY